MFRFLFTHRGDRKARSAPSQRQGPLHHGSPDRGGLLRKWAAGRRRHRAAIGGPGGATGPTQRQCSPAAKRGASAAGVRVSARGGSAPCEGRLPHRRWLVGALALAAALGWLSLHHEPQHDPQDPAVAGPTDVADSDTTHPVSPTQAAPLADAQRGDRAARPTAMDPVATRPAEAAPTPTFVSPPLAAPADVAAGDQQVVDDDDPRKRFSTRPCRRLIAGRELPVFANGVRLRRQARLVHRPDDKYPVRRVEEAVVADGDERKVVGQLEMVGDHLLVTAAAGVGPQRMARIARRFGLQVRKRLRTGNNYLLAFKPVDADSLVATQIRLSAVPDIAIAEPDFVRHISVIPDDPDFDRCWGLNNTGQDDGRGEPGTPDADIDAPAAWEHTTGSRDVLVGVIDTGIDYEHPDLVDNIWTNPGETGKDADGNDKRDNGIDDDGNGFVDDWRGWDFANDDNDPYDDNGHGTHCAGTIGASGDNGKGVAGVCWEVSLVGLKCFMANGSAIDSDAVDAIAYANLIGCDVTNNSWGGGGFNQAMYDAVEEGRQQDILYCFAAGNHAADNDATPNYPSSFDLDNVIAVAATDYNDELASFSCYGLSSVDLGAPGVNVWSTWPTGSRYYNASGTSMATPHVTGAAALVMAAHPEISNTMVKTLLIAAAEPVQDLFGKVLTGGRLNVDLAIEAVEQEIVSIGFLGHSFEDDAQGLSDGDGDGLAEPGETIELSISFRNIGTVAATGVITTLSCDNEKVSIVDGESTVGELALNGVVEADPFAIRFHEDITDGTTVDLVMHVTDDTGFNKEATIKVWVQRAYPLYGQVTEVADGSPIRGILIEVPDLTDRYTYTDGDGRYVLGVPVGTALARASNEKGGYLTVEKEFTFPPANEWNPVMGSVYMYAEQKMIIPVLEEGAGETYTESAAIANYGSLDLEWSVDKTIPLPAWLSVEPMQGTVGPGEKGAITLTIDGDAMTTGLNWHDVRINSNDPYDAFDIVTALPTLVPDRPTLTIDDVVVDEAAGVATVRAELSHTYDYFYGHFSVDTDSSGTATEYKDFEGLGMSIQRFRVDTDDDGIEEPVTTVTFDIPIHDDAVPEGDEWLPLLIARDEPMIYGMEIPAEDAIVTITDDDPLARLIQLELRDGAGASVGMWLLHEEYDEEYAPDADGVIDVPLSSTNERATLKPIPASADG